MQLGHRQARADLPVVEAGRVVGMDRSATGEAVIAEQQQQTSSSRVTFTASRSAPLAFGAVSALLAQYAAGQHVTLKISSLPSSIAAVQIRSAAR